MKNEILKAINKAIKQLCRTAQNHIDAHILIRLSTTRLFVGQKDDKFRHIYVLVKKFFPKFVCDWVHFNNRIWFWVEKSSVPLRLDFKSNFS